MLTLNGVDFLEFCSEVSGGGGEGDVKILPSRLMCKNGFFYARKLKFGT